MAQSARRARATQRPLPALAREQSRPTCSAVRGPRAALTSAAPGTRCSHGHTKLAALVLPSAKVSTCGSQQHTLATAVAATGSRYTAADASALSAVLPPPLLMRQHLGAGVAKTVTVLTRHAVGRRPTCSTTPCTRNVPSGPRGRSHMPVHRHTLLPHGNAQTHSHAPTDRLPVQVRPGVWRCLHTRTLPSQS